MLTTLDTRRSIPSLYTGIGMLDAGTASSLMANRCNFSNQPEQLGDLDLNNSEQIGHYHHASLLAGSLEKVYRMVQQLPPKSREEVLQQLDDFWSWATDPKLYLMSEPENDGRKNFVLLLFGVAALISACLLSIVGLTNQQSSTGESSKTNSVSPHVIPDPSRLCPSGGGGVQYDDKGNLVVICYP